MPYLFAWRHRKGLARFTHSVTRNTARGIAFSLAATVVIALLARRRSHHSGDAPATPPPPTDAAPQSSAPTEPESSVAATSGDDPVHEAGLESFPASDPPSTY